MWRGLPGLRGHYVSWVGAPLQLGLVCMNAPTTSCKQSVPGMECLARYALLLRHAVKAPPLLQPGI
jgi:hypothetical protein